jgi:hypothetical protein
MGVITIADMLLIFNFLDRSYLSYALVLAGFVLLFYAMRHLLRRNRMLFIPGEIFVLLLYLAGTWLGPLVSRDGPLSTQDGMVAFMMAGILLMNLGIISMYDIHIDSRMGIKSLASTMGTRAVRTLILIMGILVYMVTILQFMVDGMDHHTRFTLILAGMGSILLLILLLPSFFRRNDLYRMAADGVLFMGFLSLLIS